MPPKVFLSYSHDSAEHKDCVLALCDRLRKDGIDAWIDQYETSPPEGWPRWCANRVEEADFVLVVCTETYERRFRGAEEPARGLGAQWEGQVVIQELYEAGARNSKFIPVLFPPAVSEHIPKILRSVSRYDVSGDEGYWRLVHHLTGQPETPAPPLGSPVPPPWERRRELKSGEQRINEKDGSVLVYVPGGEYVLGADTDHATPIHRVILSPFWIAKYPLTNEHYSRYLQENPQTPKPQYWDHERLNQPQQPVVGVGWEEANAYCAWAGLQLPNEAQWEAAARGADRRSFPWGNASPTPEHANFGNRKNRPTPVGAYPKGAGPFGTLDQVGNTWEWCEDSWSPEAYRERDGKTDPVFMTGNPAVRCLRGGSWNNQAESLAAACRGRGATSKRYRDIGFRCLLPARP